jgi:steroid delta-isomerase-like uncharacterized protein
MKNKIVMTAMTIILMTITNKKMETSNIEKNKIVVRTLIEQVMNNRKTELVKQLVSEDYNGPRGLKGADAFLDPVKPLITAFPDIAWKIEDLAAEGDLVMVRWKWQGTHKAKFNFWTATGKSITNDGMAVFTLKNGKITSTSTLTDRLGFLQQIGVVPEDLSKLAVDAIKE